MSENGKAAPARVLERLSHLPCCIRKDACSEVVPIPFTQAAQATSTDAKLGA